MREWLARLRDRFRRDQLDAELADELQFHREQLERDGGAIAARRLGNLTRVKESTRDMWSIRWLDQFGRDVRYALRGFRRAPGFTAAAVLTLALGVGATTAILSIVNGVLIRPLPYPNADRALLIWSGDRRAPETKFPISLANLVDIRQESRSLERIAGFRSWNHTLTEHGDPEQLSGALVLPGLFEILGVRTALGRTFIAEEERSGGSAIISDRLWRNRFGADPAIIGRSIQLSGVPTTIVGVMPPGFHFPRGAELPSGLRFGRRTDLWTPLIVDSMALSLRGLQNLAAVAAPTRGQDAGTVTADLDLVARALIERYPGLDPNGTYTAESLLETAVAPVRPALLVLLGAVGFLLLIACVNVSSLLLTRAEARRREIAVRAAIGAASGRLARQFLAENLVLTAIGGGLGALIAIVTRHALLTLAPIDLPRFDDIVLDWRVFTGIIALVVVIGTALGTLVLAETGRVDHGALLRDGTRGSDGPGRHRARSGLVVLQVAVSVVLLAGAALLGQTLRNLQHQDPGFDPDRLLTAKPILPVTTTDIAQIFQLMPTWGRFYQQAIDEIADRPGVVGAAAISALPLSGAQESSSFIIAGRPPLEPGQQQSALFAGVSDRYFQTMGIPLVRGRSFESSDRDAPAATVVISEAMARTYWPGEDPLGSRIQSWLGRSFEVVGVVGDVRHRDMMAPPQPMMYVPLSIYSSAAMTMIVRSQAGERATAALVREVIRGLDPSVPVTEVVPMDETVAESMAQQRFSTLLLGSFGIAAIALAVLGLYGVISYGVAQRAKELGIRLALGAAPGTVRRLVMREGMTLAAIGVALGLVAAILLGRTLTTLVFGVSPTDAATLAGVTALLVVVAAVATFIPARRATRIDVVTVLREE